MEIGGGQAGAEGQDGGGARGGKGGNLSLIHIL